MVKRATGAAGPLMVSDFVTEPTPPRLSVTVSVIVYVPGRP